MKENGDDFEVGDTVRIESTVKSNEPFDEERTLSDPEEITVTITGYNDNEVVSAQDMTKNATGEYFFNWNTSSLDAGDYEVVVTASDAGVTETEDDWIKLTD